MALTTEQLLLLNNLMYTYDKAPGGNMESGCTVAEYVGSLNPANLSNSGFMTAEDWSGIITAVKSDPALMRMQIAATGVSPTGGSNAVILDAATQEAVVVYKGTAETEWMDNFRGGNMADTPCQKEALEWYQNAYKECALENYSVTVTGHSKGGNKAKYITLMDGSVDRCVSFDGQGFSDKFFEEHGDAIAQRQHLIENHNVDGDYVNILLNDVGERHYYMGQNLGNGGNAFLENHCPNSFFRVGANGELIMESAPQSELMAKADEMLNGMLRAMPDDAMRDSALEMVGKLVTGALSSEKKDLGFYTSILFSPEYAESVAFFVAYVKEYGRHELLETLLEQFGMQGAMPVVDIMLDAMDAIRIIPRWVLALGVSGICWFLETILGIDLPNELLVALITTQVSIADGSDLTVASQQRDVRIKTDSAALEGAAGALASCAGAAAEVAQKLAGVKLESAIRFLYSARISGEKERVNTEAEDIRRLESTLREIAQQYATAERAIAAMAG